jgi:hypothetical protein
MERFEGGCSCGAVRFVLRRPLWVAACHCDACKKRTGSAYGISLVVDDEAMQAFTGETTTFTRVETAASRFTTSFVLAAGQQSDGVLN